MTKIRFLALLGLLLMLGTFFVFFLHASKWNGRSKFRVLLFSQSGGAAIMSLSPETDEAIVGDIPGNLEIETAYGLGIWKVGSIWKLGEQEKKGGEKLIKETLIQRASIPIEATWQLQNTNNFGKSELLRSFFNKDSEIDLATKIRVITYLLMHPIHRIQISSLSPTPSFIKESIISTTPVLTIVNKTSSKDVYIDNLSTIIENLGARVIDIKDEAIEDGMCTVMGSDDFTKKLAAILSCNVENTGGKDTLVIKKDFLLRYGVDRS